MGWCAGCLRRGGRCRRWGRLISGCMGLRVDGNHGIHGMHGRSGVKRTTEYTKRAQRGSRGRRPSPERTPKWPRMHGRCGGEDREIHEKVLMQ